MKKKAFRKLKRLEIVELLYQLRKENIDLRRKNKSLAQQLEKSEQIVASYAGRTDDEQLERIENLLKDILRASTASAEEPAEEIDAETEPETEEESDPEDESEPETEPDQE